MWFFFSFFFWYEIDDFLLFDCFDLVSDLAYFYLILGFV